MYETIALTEWEQEWLYREIEILTFSKETEKEIQSLFNQIKSDSYEPDLHLKLSLSQALFLIVVPVFVIIAEMTFNSALSNRTRKRRIFSARTSRTDEMCSCQRTRQHALVPGVLRTKGCCARVIAVRNFCIRDKWTKCWSCSQTDVKLRSDNSWVLVEEE
jgi:hypothetical protein